MQKIPDINLIAHDENFTCDVCNEEASFLIGPNPINDGKNRCGACFVPHRPEYSEAVTDFSDLLDLMLDMQSRMMTQEMMYELYGNLQEEEPDI